MHDITEDFHIFGGTFNANDIAQGSLGNCYLLAALASLQNPRNGEYIRNIFKTQVNINLIFFFINKFRLIMIITYM